MINNKKVFAIGMIDDIMDDQAESKRQKDEEYKLKIIENSVTIRNVIKQI